MSPVPDDDRGWFELVLSNQPPLWELYADAFDGMIERIGDVQAAVIPSSPNRSFFNSVFYEDPEALVAALPRLAEIYDEAGVNAWTVWIPADDEVARAGLEDAGHGLDATPGAMGLDMAELEPPEPDSELEIRTEMDTEACRSINEIAYGYPEGDFPPMKPMPETEIYLADLNGETVGTTLTWDRGDDVEITFVAVLPEARGRGVSGRILGHALERERERGKVASTLIATKLGRPVYEKLGYRHGGGLEMWERRR
ncbi:MAG TPA: GNAT family N-acetyltransferase [Solirubrobacterales bacterium]|nr:GNAT family N-acetyltransferase [Solirubrobacterales bacterium]